jgi:CheY-like chemotaxis protein
VACTHNGGNRGVVLIVEDERDIREIVGELLTSEGFRVLSAADGRQALELLQNGPRPCLVLLDLVMPVMNGYQFMDVLMADTALRTLPVVLVSALNAGMPNGPLLLRKPIHADQLLSCVQAVCA